MADYHQQSAPPHFAQIIVLILLAILVAAYHNHNPGWIRDAFMPSHQKTEIIQQTQDAAPSPIRTSTPEPSVALLRTNFTEISKGDTSKKQVIITFDAGSGEHSYEGIMAALAKHNVKGSFFLVGKWVEEHPDLTRRLVAEGHEIFNHSYSHPYFTQLSAEEIKSELQKMDDVLYATAGVRTKPYYRPPYGDRNDEVNRAAAEAGYQSIYWSVDSLDWREGETTESVENRVLSNIHSGAIVLLHVGNTPTGDVMDEIFTTLEEQGYKLVSLTEGL